VWILLFGPNMTAERVAQGIARTVALVLFGVVSVGLMYGLREYSDNIVDAALTLWQKEWKFLAVCGTLITLVLLLGSSRRR
jgi:hypothetical protein